MRRFVLLIALTLCFLPAYAQYGRRQGPETAQNSDFGAFEAQSRTLFNFDWKFRLGACEGARDPALDDSAWRQLDLPHDFRFELPWDGTLRSSANDFKPSCEGWYRKEFRADPCWEGKKVFLKGVAIHHDLGALGAAAFDTGIERLFRTLKEFGYNSVRCSHNPYSRSFTRIADRMGILIVDELIDKWADDIFWGGRVPFSDYWPRMIPAWVKRDRNCPSVILWSLGNELQVRENMCGYSTGDWGVTTYRIFDVMVKRYDPTRVTTVALSPGKAGGLVFWDKDAWLADGLDLQYLKVYAVDRKGRVVPAFDEPLSLSLEGPATFVALDNGDHFTDELFYNVTTKKMKGGFMQVILRSQRGEAGAVRVKLTTPSLKTTVNLVTI